MEAVPQFHTAGSLVGRDSLPGVHGSGRDHARRRHFEIHMELSLL